MTHGDDGVELSKEELKTLRRLRKLAKEWPDTLWLFNNGNMYVMRKKPEDGSNMDKGGVDRAHLVEIISGMNSEGGDW